GSTRSPEVEEVLRQQHVRWRADGRCTQSIRRALRVARRRSSLRIFLARCIPNRCISSPSPLVGGQQRNRARRPVQPIVTGHGENRQQSQFLLQLPQPPCEEPTLRLAPNQGQRLLIRITRLRK